MPGYPLLIDGQLVNGDHESLVVNPATGAPFEIHTCASRRQLEAAVEAAGQAFPMWSELFEDERRNILISIAAVLEGNRDDLASLLTTEQGKPLRDAKAEIDQAATLFLSAAKSSLFPSGNESSSADCNLALRRPLGVVGVITSPNFPLLELARILPLALLAGNTVAITPSTTTPLTTLLLGRLISGIVPAGVINILSDSGSLGPVLASHPEVTMISFSGSVDAGRSIMASAAPTLKRLSLNIDGNDAAILLADVDIDKAADDLFKSAFANSGQSGVGVKRVYAHRSIYNQLCETLSYTAKRTKVGNGMDEDVTMGPIQNGVSYEHAKRYLATANIDGDVLSGGSGLEGYGYFIQPTIVRNIPKNSSLVTEIQYCPILPIMAFDHVGDALEQVGGPTSDLGVSIWTNRPAYAHDLAVRVQARNVWINGHADLADISVWSDDQQSTVNFQIFTELLASVTKPQTLRFVTMQ